MAQYAFLDQVALQDTQFLQDLCTSHYREIYAKIIALDNDENPVEEIQGTITNGSVSVDGNSIVRRTCSLTMTATDIDITDYLWGLKTKMHLFVGLKNDLNPQYADIIWFKMGLYVLTSFSVSIGTDGSYSISLQGKDKMCLLNGDLGGNLTALSYDFANLSIIDEYGNYTTEPVPLIKLLTEAIHIYGNEPYHNIIINDLDMGGLELLEYHGTTPLIFIAGDEEKDGVMTRNIRNCTMNLNAAYYYKGQQKVTLKELIEQTAIDTTSDTNEIIQFNQFTDLLPSTINYYFTASPEIEGVSQTHFYLIKIEPGMTCGYRNTDLVFAGDLTMAVGNPITQVISKVVEMLGDYEYFYNLDGQFIFQKKRTSTKTVWNNIKTSDDTRWVDTIYDNPLHSFSFANNTLITSFSNNPTLSNIKNDFTIWGARTGIGGASIPIHMRYAIHKKPKFYVSYDGLTLYTTCQNTGAISAEFGTMVDIDPAIFPNINDPMLTIKLDLDWRELIYQMAKDHNAYHTENDFFATIAKNNAAFYPYGKTGYEQYYLDMLEFWRSLYNPDTTTSYESIEVERKQFKNLARFNDWYYKALDNTIKPIPMAPATFPPPWIDETDGKTYTGPFYNSKGQKVYKKVLVSEIEKVIDLYYKEVTESYYPCVQLEPFQKQVQYYYYDNNEQEYKIALGLKKETYDANPFKYYVYRLKDGNYGYRWPIEKSYEYNPNVTYWIKTNDQYIQDTDLIFDPTDENSSLVTLKEEYDQKLTVSPSVYYYKQSTSTLEPVVQPAIVYDLFLGKYYKKITEHFAQGHEHKGWSKTVVESPENLNFWIDFLDTQGELEQYSIANIGSRPVSKNDNNVTAIYYRDVVPVLFSTNIAADQEKYGLNTAYSYLQLPQSYQSLFSLSSQGQSAKNMIDTLLNENTNFADSISISAIPIYYLEPNTRILVSDEQSHINGEYAITRLSFPLDANGTMSITATKIIGLLEA